MSEKQPKEIRELRKRVKRERDFIHLPRYENSVEVVMQKYPDGAPDSLIAQALMLDDVQSVEALYQSAVLKLRAVMNGGPVLTN